MGKVKIVVTVPESHADTLRRVMGDAGAGKIGNYAHCSFSTRGQGRFLPLDGANPAIGAVGNFEIVNEERIEVTCSDDDIAKVVEAIKSVHPYEEVAYDVYTLWDI